MAIIRRGGRCFSPPSTARHQRIHLSLDDIVLKSSRDSYLEEFCDSSLLAQIFVLCVAPLVHAPNRFPTPLVHPSALHTLLFTNRIPLLDAHRLGSKFNMIHREYSHDPRNCCALSPFLLPQQPFSPFPFLLMKCDTKTTGGIIAGPAGQLLKQSKLL
ncbi:hypothetical protein C8R44DRAFT_990411 [Mycena epipterygia]|nr:hypothetical protein C8R44DRAFT_990411 [Mycena epipterygia]